MDEWVDDGMSAVLESEMASSRWHGELDLEAGEAATR
jgi:hypothetical protein